MSISAQIGFGELQNQSKFALVIQRILGLCFDDRTEIDVSGIAKVAELDGVDDTFFELNEIDLRNIDQNISNVQNGVMEFEECDNVKVPVDSESLVDQLILFRDKLSGQTNEEKVKAIETIVDSISQNPEWKPKLPLSFNANIAIDKNIIKKISLAVAAGVLTPKNLLPVFSLLYVIQSGATYTYNQAVTSGNTLITTANTLINSGNTLLSQTSNIVIDGKDFLQKWRTFSIEMVSKINVIFLETLFQILKRDLILLIGEIVKDIETNKAIRKYQKILALIAVAYGVTQLLKNDYRKCKPLLQDILAILTLVESAGKTLGILKKDIPLSLLAFADFLPGYSPERAFINVIEGLQAIGVPTGILPDGSPNLMLLYNKITQNGIAKEKKNEKIEAFGVGVTGMVKIYGVPV